MEKEVLVEEARPAHRVARWVVGGTCILADAAAAKAENLATAEATLWVPVAVAMAAVEGLPAVAVAAARLRKVASAAVVAVETAGAAQDFAVDLAVWAPYGARVESCWKLVNDTFDSDDSRCVGRIPMPGDLVQLI